ncbi:hypothetical protein SAMD00023353_0702400 [Rosellinia necatrix]|uniref:Uncharacterized protein n=1 Tax=Rosellinia necatrix TaxID=77044 RepID=A0A1S8A703_ROSNE|nr:hypothetical protein SAMD00023353_0702400 [Rosellinia necatrix]
MCLYQDIHTAHHHAEISACPDERAAHRCPLRYPAAAAAAGHKCPLHSCCRLSRALVRRCRGDVERPGSCGRATGVTAVPADDGRCARRLVRDAVFAAFPDGEAEALWPEDFSDHGHGDGDGHGDDPPLHRRRRRAHGSYTMAFWPEDGCGVIKLVCGEHEDEDGGYGWVPREGGRPEDVRREAAGSGEGDGEVPAS